MTLALDGQLAVVTGAFGKLGPIWCEALLSAGARVLAIDLPGAVPPEALASAVTTGRLLPTFADVRDRARLDDLCTDVTARFGTAHVLVNNAGIDAPPASAGGQLLQQVGHDEFLRVLDVNVAGSFAVAQAFGPSMAAAGRGSIINIGSLYASVAPDRRFYDHFDMDPPFLKPPAYGASKAALVNLTKYLATYWGPSGVRVNALSPGGILGGQDAEFRRKFAARVPLGRLGETRDLGGPLLFLASDASSYVTGIELRVDGGFTAW